MFIKSTYVLQKSFISLIFRLFHQKFQKMTKNTQNFIILGSKTPKNELLTLNYGLPSSFITLSAWKTTKRG